MSGTTEQAKCNGNILELHEISVWLMNIQGGSNMTGTNCDLFTHK
jgi:hypothetical protein